SGNLRCRRPSLLLAVRKQSRPTVCSRTILRPSHRDGGQAPEQAPAFRLCTQRLWISSFNANVRHARLVAFGKHKRGGSVEISRRELLMAAALGALGANRSAQGAEAKIETKQRMRAGAKPVLIAAGNSYAYLNAGYALLRKGGDTLDAAIEVVRGPEDDPN